MRPPQKKVNVRSLKKKGKKKKYIAIMMSDQKKKKKTIAKAPAELLLTSPLTNTRKRSFDSSDGTSFTWNTHHPLKQTTHSHTLQLPSKRIERSTTSSLCVLSSTSSNRNTHRKKIKISHSLLKVIGRESRAHPSAAIALHFSSTYTTEGNDTQEPHYPFLYTKKKSVIM